MAEKDLQGEVAGLNLLNPRQRELVETDIENLERALYGKAMRYGGGDPTAQSYQPGDEMIAAEEHGFMGRTPPQVPEPALIEHNLRADRQMLHLGSAPAFSGHRKNLLYTMYKQAVKDYQEGLLSHGQMWDANVANIHHHIRHEDANRARGKFIANMRKIFEPEEDDFSLDELRPHDPIRINSAAFRKHFENIQWTDKDELQRQVSELDNETYVQFLELRARTQDSGVIMTKLVIDRATYDACEARLATSHTALGEAEQETPPAPETEATVPMTHLEAVVQYVVIHPNETYRDLLKGFPLKEHGMQVNEFAKALKAAHDNGLLDKQNGQYVLAQDLEEPVGQETVSGTPDTLA